MPSRLKLDREFLAAYIPNDGREFCSTQLDATSWKKKDRLKYSYCPKGAAVQALGLLDRCLGYSRVIYTLPSELVSHLTRLEEKLWEGKIKPKTAKSRLIKLLNEFYPED